MLIICWFSLFTRKKHLTQENKTKLRFPYSQVTEVSMEEYDKGLGQCGDNKERKIEVSGGNLSLVVDLSGSFSGVSSGTVFQSSGTCLKEENDQEFLVGNLVWAMNKSRKWWPGEVVDFKADAKESFSVRFLGESQVVSWCAASKLKPFKESFEKVVYERMDLGFLVAVQKAMTLLGNSLKLDMTCSCIGDGNGGMEGQNGKPWKKKPLILGEFSVDRLVPKEFVAELKDLAKCVFNAGRLETTVMQSRLSVFYSFVGHKKIPMDQLHHQTEGRKRRLSAVMEPSQFVGSPSVVAGNSRYKFRKQWFRKFVSEVDNVSARDVLVNTSPSDLISELKMVAVDYNCSDVTQNIGLVEWFFSKFRISAFHDENLYKMQLANMAGLKDSRLAKRASPNAHLKTSTSKKLGKSKIESFDGDTEQKIFESHMSEKLKTEVFRGVRFADTERKISGSKKLELSSNIETHNGFLTPDSEHKASNPKKLHSRPAAMFVPDLNRGGSGLASAESDHLQRPDTLIPPNVVPQVKETARPTMFNFQGPAQCSTYGTGFVSNQTALERNFTSADLDLTSFDRSEMIKRGRKRKNAEPLPMVAHNTSGIPDLNRITTEPALGMPQVEPTKRRRRRKKEELTNGLTRGITILFLKFSSQASMPSRDDLTSTFSAFGPLDSSETHISEEYSCAQVAFVSCSDAIEAVKSLEKTNPFGETLMNFRLQHKMITVQRNITPRMPVISQISPIPPQLNTPPTSFDSMKQNLRLLTAMVEKSGDSLSREMKAKLKSEITALLDKINSVPSSSSS